MSRPIDLVSISTPECGAKPTAYLAVLNGVSRKELRRHLKRGFAEAFTRPVKIKRASIESAIDELLESDYTWIDEYYLVEITRLNEEN